MMRTWDGIARSRPVRPDGRAGHRSGPRPRLAAFLLAAVALAWSSGRAAGGPPPQGADTIDLLFAYGSEKKVWIEAVTKQFNDARFAISDRRVIKVRTRAMGSGDIIDDLLRNDLARPAARCNPAEPLKAHVISPASRAFLKIGNARSRELTKDQRDLVIDNDDGDGCPVLVQSPVVIAMWTQAAQALECWPPPAKGISWTRFFDFVRDKDQWPPIRPAGFDGPFRYGHTHANYSNSGLHALVCEGYAAVGRFRGVTGGMVNGAGGRIGRYLGEIETQITHYGESTGTLANKMVEEGKNYLTAAVLYENVVISLNQDYLKGKPKGTEPRMVAVYPTEGTFMSDHPIAVVNRGWVGKAEKDAADRYIAFLLDREQQLKAMNSGFRPALKEIKLDPKVFDARFGVDPAQPKGRALETPSATVIDGLLKLWNENKRHAEVVLALDKSSSMLERIGNGGCRRVEYAREAAEEFLGMIGDEDSVSILTFGRGDPEWSVEDAVMGKDQPDADQPGKRVSNRDYLKLRLNQDFQPGRSDDTPMYKAIAAAHDHLTNRDRRNSRVIIVLSDGADSRPNQLPRLDQLLAQVRPQPGEEAIRVITIGFLIDGEPHRKILQSLATTTGGQFFEVKSEDEARRDPAKKDLRQVFKDIITLF